MPWAFNATGLKEACMAALDASMPPEDPVNAQQHKDALDMIRRELKQYGDGSTEMNIAASGHVPGPGYSDRSFSIWISGRAAPPVEPAAKPAPSADRSEPHVEAVAPVTTRGKVR